MPENQPKASFDNPRFQTKHGFGPQKQGHRSGDLANLPAEETLRDQLDDASPNVMPAGHSRQLQTGIEVARQQDILTDRVEKEAAIIAGKSNQEIQQTSASSTRS